jgi:hypothetical protein
MKSVGHTGRGRGVIVASLAVAAAVIYANLLAGTGDPPGAVSTATAGGATGATATQVEALAREGIPADRAVLAIEVQGRISRADLVAQLESAMGRAFGGVWYEPATAQLHVGVTSAASRRIAAETAARAGLAAYVTETQVDSTWADLTAMQTRIDGRLEARLGRAEAATSISSQRNAVQVELGSAVAPGLEAALRREASSEGADLDVTEVGYPHLGIRRQSRCNKFTAAKAYCDKPIVAGVTIGSPVIGGKQSLCTAGPAVIRQDLSKETTETFILTAGHCIQGKGGNGGKWSAFNKAGEETEIGPALEYLEETKGDKADVGVIKVNKPGKWAEESQIPVAPTIAPWSEAEPEPFPVVGEAKPVEGNVSCMSGQISGEVCGPIVATELTIAGLQKLVEVGNVTTALGDSGAPWFSIEETTFAQAEGTNVGEREKTKNPVFVPLEFSLEQLKTKFELLTEANEERPKCPMQSGCAFEAESYPVTLDGGDASGGETFTTEAGTMKCKSSFHGEVTEAEQLESFATVEVHPTYTGCTASGISATVTTSSESGKCDYLLHVTETVSADEHGAKTDIVCTGGFKMKAVFATCEIEIGPQTGLKSLRIVNDTSATPKKDVTLHPELTAFSYTVTKDGFLCPYSGTGSRTDGKYINEGQVTITGQSPSSPSTKIGISVG